MSVWPNGMASEFGRNHPGTVSDLSIRLYGIDYRLKRTEKHEDDDLFQDSYHLHGKFPNH